MRWFCTLKKNAFSHIGDGYLEAHKLPGCLFLLRKEVTSAGNKSSLAEGYLIYPLKKYKRSCLYIVELNFTKFTGTLLR